jgi:hypothetical protein
MNGMIWRSDSQEPQFLHFLELSYVAMHLHINIHFIGAHLLTPLRATQEPEKVIPATD